MTIGEKIRFFRTKRGMTQGKLAELSDIHPVSIRKYETNKTVPQPAQMAKIAEALNISNIAIQGVSEETVRMDTRGDLMGLLMFLYEAGVIQAKGKRNEDGSIDKETFELKFNPVLAPFFEMQVGEGQYPLADVLVNIKDTAIYEDFLLWAQVSYNRTKAILSASTVEDAMACQQDIQKKDVVELELQSLDIPLASE